MIASRRRKLRRTTIRVPRRKRDVGGRGCGLMTVQIVATSPGTLEMMRIDGLSCIPFLISALCHNHIYEHQRRPHAHLARLPTGGRY